MIEQFYWTGQLICLAVLLALTTWRKRMNPLTGFACLGMSFAWPLPALTGVVFGGFVCVVYAAEFLHHLILGED